VLLYNSYSFDLRDTAYRCAYSTFWYRGSLTLGTRSLASIGEPFLPGAVSGSATSGKICLVRARSRIKHTVSFNHDDLCRASLAHGSGRPWRSGWGARHADRGPK
jgi:hypothetical protein